MDPATERESLRILLDAVDARADGLPALLAARPREGQLFGALAATGLDDLDVGLLLVALAARLAGRGHVSGDDLVAGLTRRSADRLAALCRLQAEGPLVTAGLLVPDTPPQHPADAAHAAWCLADAPFRLACEVSGHQPPPRPPAARGPYRSQRELLADLRRLSIHYRRRAARAFGLDPWIGVGLESPDGADLSARRAREAAALVASRLAATSDDSRLPVLRFKKQHGLDLDSLVIVITLLFHELLEGLAVVDAVDLLRLVSENEEDLLRHRQILRPLERAGLLRLEGAYAGKELTADASLPNRVVDELVGAEAIGADDRIDFHAWLKGLDGSDPFFFDPGR